MSGVVGAAGDLIYFHLDEPKSSAFNTIRLYILMERMLQLEVNRIIRWVGSILTDRSQYVRVNAAMSSSIITNTGSPQGTNSSHVFSDKFKDETEYWGCVDKFVDWCHANFLHPNTKRTKEMILDFRASKGHTLGYRGKTKLWSLLKSSTVRT
uniref:Uncharacterized protein n=1 Tax=Lates calcarifer TaxID=8187 RepID=A0A4W6DRF4_LATCA